MTIEFRMPSLGPDMEAGTLVEWRVKPGDRVKHGDVVALVETDKGVIDVEVFSDAVVERLLLEPGVKVPVGEPLAHLSGEAPEPRAVSSAGIAALPVAPPVAVPASGPHPVSRSGRVRISPAARAKAQALGLDPTKLSGSGPGGVITLEDIEKRHAVAPPRVDKMREVIARAMAKSKREIPHFYLTASCCYSNARAWLETYNSNVSIESRLLPAALFIKAVAAAARAVPGFNGFYDDAGFVPAADVNVGVAIAMRGGLVAPAVLAADTKNIAAIMDDLRDLTNRVRGGHMRATELALPTITVTSLGEDGIDTMTPVIYPPQVSIVAFGSIVERAWVIDGSVRPAPVVMVTLAADHRVSDGRIGARFLRHIIESLQAPERL